MRKSVGGEACLFAKFDAELEIKYLTKENEKVCVCVYCVWEVYVCACVGVCGCVCVCTVWGVSLCGGVYVCACMCGCVGVCVCVYVCGCT